MGLLEVGSNGRAQGHVGLKAVRRKRQVVSPQRCACRYVDPVFDQMVAAHVAFFAPAEAQIPQGRAARPLHLHILCVRTHARARACIYTHNRTTAHPQVPAAQLAQQRKGVAQGCCTADGALLRDTQRFGAARGHSFSGAFTATRTRAPRVRMHISKVAVYFAYRPLLPVLAARTCARTVSKSGRGCVKCP